MCNLSSFWDGNFSKTCITSIHNKNLAKNRKENILILISVQVYIFFFSRFFYINSKNLIFPLLICVVIFLLLALNILVDHFKQSYEAFSVLIESEKNKVYA